MSEEDINFLISIQDLEQPEFDNACLERENERLRNKLQQKENIIKEVREYIEKHIAIFKGGDMLVNMNIDELLEILDKPILKKSDDDF